MSLRFFLGSTLRHSSLQASSRYRPIARDRRGSSVTALRIIQATILAGHESAYTPFRIRFCLDRDKVT
jgi:hypothetical protein